MHFAYPYKMVSKIFIQAIFSWKVYVTPNRLDMDQITLKFLTELLLSDFG